MVRQEPQDAGFVGCGLAGDDHLDPAVQIGIGDADRLGSTRAGGPGDVVALPSWARTGCRGEPVKPKELIDRYCAGESVRFLQERDKARPFFLWHCSQLPHMAQRSNSWPATKANLDRYDVGTMPLPQTWKGDQAGKPDWLARSRNRIRTAISRMKNHIQFSHRNFIQAGLALGTLAPAIGVSAEDNRKAAYHNAGVKTRPYGIPLSALIGRDVDGLMMAGRCISGDFIAHASYRVTGNAGAMGEAAGATAATAAKNKTAPHDVPWSEVKPVIEKIRTANSQVRINVQQGVNRGNLSLLLAIIVASTAPAARGGTKYLFVDEQYVQHSSELSV